MTILLVTEIWGRTSHVEAMADALRSVGNSVLIVDPYDGTDPGFVNEDEAYAEYLAACGHEEYARRVVQGLCEVEGPVSLLGFSAGAGAVWAAVTEVTGEALSAFCFYGSSIRTMHDRTPRVPTYLVFPNYEKHFDVDEVIVQLQGKDRTQCFKADGGHGFMNPMSENYSENLHKLWFDWILEKLS
ncbi:dienelactone hydrolase family protein [Pseudodesulfovibrio sp. zrk46]|uniref:dienelactone hydrolase family protein n=1 Tax=Pseudodesulfovibrio sp. zrk46 TaxID=2725288 RepID=UPI001448AD1C|nr:dienelactone hydrolase family protein [Pseudodesulfovibrio sp. zrk46]QJB57045.1 dienelactone hydrolase [Pseudodesulfovibrio sp. zrk46]